MLDIMNISQDWTTACSEAVPMLCSNVSHLVTNQPVDNICLGSHHDLNISYQTMYSEQSLYQSPSRLQWTFDLDNVLEDFGSPCVDDVEWWTTTPKYRHETPDTRDFQLQFPYNFDKTDGYCQSSSTNTYAVSTVPEVDPCEADTPILESIFHYSSSDGSHYANTLCTSSRQQISVRSVDNTAAISAPNVNSSDDAFPQNTPLTCVSFGDRNDTATPFQTHRCLDLPGNATCPLQARSFFSQNHSSVTKIASDQTDVFEQFPSLPGSDYQQPDGFLINHQSGDVENRPITTPFRTVHVSGDISTPSPVTTNTWSRNNLTRPSCPYRVRWLADNATTQIACRRQLFRETACRQDNDYRLCRKQQDNFQHTPSRSCYSVKDIQNQPFTARNKLDYSKDLISRLKFRGCGEGTLYETPRIPDNLEECSTFADCRSRPVFSSEEIGETQTSGRRQPFGDTSCCGADKAYGVSKNSQQQHDLFQKNQPQSSHAEIDKEDSATTPFGAIRRVEFSDFCSDFSSAEADKPEMSCCRKDVGYRVRKKLPNSKQDHITDRNTMTKQHVCSICHRRFAQPSNLAAHQRTHTGERPFACPITVCRRRFTQSSSLRTHMRTHSGVRPYVCGRCGRAFSDSSTLTKHDRVHTGCRPYRCDVCPAAFSQSGNLRRHQRIHLLVDQDLIAVA